MNWQPVQVGTTRQQRERGYTEAWTLVHRDGTWYEGEAVTSRRGALRIARNLPADPARAEALNSAAVAEWAEELAQGSKR